MLVRVLAQFNVGLLWGVLSFKMKSIPLECLYTVVLPLSFKMGKNNSVPMALLQDSVALLQNNNNKKNWLDIPYLQRLTVSFEVADSDSDCQLGSCSFPLSRSLAALAEQIEAGPRNLMSRTITAHMGGFRGWSDSIMVFSLPFEIRSICQNTNLP